MPRPMNRGRIVAGDVENHTIHWDADTGTLTLLELP